MTARRAALHFLPLLLSCAAACARAPRVTLPTGAGVPFPEFAQAYRDATADCGAIRTLSVSMSLSGRAGNTKLGARIDAGFADPDQLRLEGFPRVSFRGKPAFVLVSRGSDATLVLMVREPRVLRGAPPSAMIEALAGVALEPSELRTIVSGCGIALGQPSAGRSFENAWAAVDAGGSTVFLRQVDGRWRIAAARRGSLTVEYSGFTSVRPSTVRLRTSAQVAADLTLRLSQMDINAPIDRAAFEPDVPRDAEPITLEELRRAGPLGHSETGTEATQGARELNRRDAKARSRLRPLRGMRA